MAFKVTLINPPLVHLAGDPYSSIPYMPTGLLYLAGYLEASGVDVSFVDGFGLAPTKLNRIDDTLASYGLTENEVVDLLGDTKLVGIAVHSGMSHSIALRLAEKIKKRYPSTVLIAGGNHASVVPEQLLDGGFDYVCIGEGEHPLLALVKWLRDGEGDLSRIPGLAYCDGHMESHHGVLEEDLDKFGFAALHMLPLKNYWKLRMQHAPVLGKYMVITTSRGCIYNCRFCTTPKLLGRKWRTRTPKNIVDEIQAAVDAYGITDVIIQDELFGCRKEAAQAFAQEILVRKLNIRFSLPSGIKIETTDEETLAILKEAGLWYLVFAPESGSKRVLKKMGKPLDFEKLYRLVPFVKKIGLNLSCVFVLGFEDENDADRKLTRDLALKLTRLGADEISLFIWSPLPGADSFESESGWSRYEELNWTPSWRDNYKNICRFRNALYRDWALTKSLYHPLKCLRSAGNVVTGRCELKFEMALLRIVRSHIPFHSRDKG
ncbi:B12-binding domain-containing radical SAM protein [Candidatus Hydrogenedentota bacterium]